MGIKGLNKYFKMNVSDKAIHQHSISELRGKTVVIDTSIYMYKFLEDGMLFENMFAFISQCVEYDVTPLFVFDGKPHDMKYEVCMTRYKKRVQASEKYKDAQEQYALQSKVMTPEEKGHWVHKLADYKKKAIRVKGKYIDTLKEMMDAMGVFYCDAPNEADVVCACYVRQGIAWACVSDDMDMFAYGCPRVLREWNVQKASVMLYDLEAIQEEFRIPEIHLREVLLLVGNDYTKTRLSMDTVMEWYRRFETDVTTLLFVPWLVKRGYITKAMGQKWQTISSLYDEAEETVLEMVMEKENATPTLSQRVCAKPTDIQWEKLQSILMPYGFVFIV
jgi:5'-3' exonuclease